MGRVFPLMIPENIWKCLQEVFEKYYCAIGSKTTENPPRGEHTFVFLPFYENGLSGINLIATNVHFEKRCMPFVVYGFNHAIIPGYDAENDLFEIAQQNLQGQIEITLEGNMCKCIVYNRFYRIIKTEQFEHLEDLKEFLQSKFVPRIPRSSGPGDLACECMQLLSERIGCLEKIME